jgi:hypothetical protein
MNLRTGFSAFGLLALTLAACGGGSSKQQTVSDFCMQYAAAVCNVTAACGSVPSTATCEATEMANCNSSASMATQPGVRVFTAGNVSSCISMTTSIYKQNTPITPTQMEAQIDACAYVFQGTVPKGMPCTTKYDCAGKVICDKGVCATQTNKNKGDGCSDAGAVCAAGSFCQKGTNGFYTCVAKGAANAACDDSTPCLETLRCSASKCTDQVAAGGACANNDDCVSAAPYCDKFAGGTCDTGLRFAPGSASCAQFATPTGAGGAGGAVDGGAGMGGAGGASGAAGGGTDASGAGGADATGAGGSDGGTTD